MQSTIRLDSLRRITLPLWLLRWLASGFATAQPPGAIPPLAEVVTAKQDVWGELAMRQPNGASYEFFEPLLPPPRYVHADYRYYPLVLSAEVHRPRYPAGCRGGRGYRPAAELNADFHRAQFGDNRHCPGPRIFRISPAPAGDCHPFCRRIPLSRPRCPSASPLSPIWPMAWRAFHARLSRPALDAARWPLGAVAVIPTPDEDATMP